jgi:aspartate aminotransferase-like enzyme
MISFMPGPAEIAREVQAAFQMPPVSHRSADFVSRFEAVRARLRALTGAPHIALFQGSGTLANDAIASCLSGDGVILVNGEFGRRIAQQALRWQLPARILEWPWGTPWPLDQVRGELGPARWIWGVHLETSTGMLNDIHGLSRVARDAGVRLCLDCISSLGSVPVDLRDVWLASGVSGKSLGAYTGLAFVFASEPPRPAYPVPQYLDVAETIRTEGPRFTFSSPLLFALERALEMRYDYSRLGCLVRENLRKAGIAPLVPESFAAPTVTTFASPSPAFLDRCRARGYALGGDSDYLATRGLVQIATMGAVSPRHVEDFFAHWEALSAKASAA